MNWRDEWSYVSAAVGNRTRQGIPSFPFSPIGNGTNPSTAEGFFDSLFDAETADEVYLKVTVICLWVIVFLLLLFTLISFLWSSSRSTEKMIRFHIYVCEFFYLIYILLSMINVASDFQLNSCLCNIANHGMYIDSKSAAS